jgi:phosphoserine phosphatase
LCRPIQGPEISVTAPAGGFDLVADGMGQGHLRYFARMAGAGRSRAQLEGLREAFMRECIVPRIPASARALVDAHRSDGELLVLSTATKRYLSELTAIGLAFEHLIATKPEESEGVFTGRAKGMLNMREGKPARLRDWLATMRLPAAMLSQATFYSDSIKDMPLLCAVAEPVVDPDP